MELNENTRTKLVEVLESTITDIMDKKDSITHLVEAKREDWMEIVERIEIDLFLLQTKLEACREGLRTNKIDY